MRCSISTVLIIGTWATFSACGGRSKIAVAPYVASADAAPREQTGDQQVRQALSRITFGARAGDVARVRAMGVDSWIADQLRPDGIVDSRARQFLATFETQRASAAELQAKYPRPNQLLRQLGAGGDRAALSAVDGTRLRLAGEGFRRIPGEIRAARVVRGLLSERQLEEVMTDFWLNHFSVYIQKGGPEPYLITAYENAAIRPNALGNFRTLLGAVAHSPAMLYYLDNWESSAESTRPRLVPQRRDGGGKHRGGLNENYGRELLELHTLGVDGGYTQQDVINVARAFTGWTLRGPRDGVGGSQFVASRHDAGEKMVLGHRLAAGRGENDGEDVLDILARHPRTARFIAFKLARRFVSDQPPPELVDRAAETFRRTNGDLREVVRTIVTSPEFFALAAYRSKVKSPFEVVVSALRALGAQPDTTPRTAAAVGALGQPIYGHQAPNGWPETGPEWMNTGAILGRINFGLTVATGRIPGVSVTGWPGADSLANAPRERQVDGVIAALLGDSVSAQTRSALLGDGATGALSRDGAFGALAALKGLPQIVALALASPEFQRR